MYLSEKDYQNQMQKIRLKNESKARKEKLKAAKKYGFKMKKPSTSHMVLWAVIIISSQIIWFAEDMIRTTGDTGQLYSLIGIPVALVPILVSYFSKSAKENTVGGIVYDTAMKNLADGDAAG